MSTGLEPTPAQLAALASRPPDEPVVMVNLLKFKTPGGVESYQRYGWEVLPHLQRAGGIVRYVGEAPAFVIGDGERPWWDAILIVEYPTPRAFIDMVRTPEYLQAQEHRAAGLERAELIATSAWLLGM